MSYSSSAFKNINGNSRKNGRHSKSYIQADDREYKPPLACKICEHVSSYPELSKQNINTFLITRSFIVSINCRQIWENYAGTHFTGRIVTNHSSVKCFSIARHQLTFTQDITWKRLNCSGHLVVNWRVIWRTYYRRQNGQISNLYLPQEKHCTICLKS